MAPTNLHNIYNTFKVVYSTYATLRTNKNYNIFYMSRTTYCQIIDSDDKEPNVYEKYCL